jgi:dynein heavy chain
LKARALPTLSNFKPNSNARSSSSIKKARLLDPISPYIKNRGMTPLPLEKLRGETPMPDFDPISLTERRFPKEELVTKSLATTRTRAKKKHMHGDLSFTKFDGSYVNLKAKRPTPFDFLEIIRSDPELKDDFWYCNRVGGSYEFEFVRFADKNPQEYLTISSRGVTHFVNGEAEFMTLGEWEREYRLYARVKDIKFFKQYKLWKNFSLWKNIRRRNMIRDRAQFLGEQLFLLDNRLREPMLNVRTIGYRVAKMDVIDYSFDAIRTVKTFEADQEAKRNLVSDTIYNIEKDVLGIVVTACKTSMDDFRKENKSRNVEDDEEKDPFLIGDSTRRQMPFTQEAIVRTHYRKLAKFIRLCEFHVLDAKVTLAYTSAQKLLEIITFEYSKSTKESASATLRKQHQPLWSIDLNFEGLNLIYDPMPDNLKTLLDDTFAKVMKILLRSYILIYSPELEKYSKSLEELEDKHLEEEFDIYQLIISEEEMVRKEENIRKGIDTAFYRVYTYCKRYQRCLEIYKENESMDLNYFRTVDSDIVKEAIDTYYKEEKEFKALEESVNLGLFQLNLKDMKHKLIPSPKLCITKLENFLPQHSLQKAAHLVKELNDSNRFLAITPQNVNDYVEHLKNVRIIEEQLTDFNMRFNDIKDNMQLMEGYGIRFPDDVRQKYNDTVQALNLLHQRTTIFYERDESNKIRFSRELRDKMGQVEKRNKSLKERVSDPRISDKNSQTGEMVGLLKNIGEDVEQLYTDTQDYNNFAKELDIERVSFAAVVDTRRDYKLKADLWNSLHEWTYKTLKWNSTSFGVIDVDAISKEVDHYYRIAQRSRVLEEDGNFVPQVLRAKVEALKDTMPVVTDLRCKALKPRHWEQLCKIIGAQVDINDPNFTLEDLLDSEVNDKRDEIAEVALRARKEEELEKQLNDVVAGWNGLEFHFKYDREKDYYIFKDIDEIQTKLEDTQVVLSTIMANRFIGPLYERVDNWNKKFALFAATFDEWLICQKNWAELEKIFSSPDIAKQMHDKTKKFNQINIAFKELMRSTSERPDALEAATRPSLLADLRSWNERLERLQKDLEEYLDRKRKLFGRFFFLSNEELLTILSNSQKPDSIQPHLRNMFENIYLIKFSSDKPEDVEEMISIEGEAVNLGKNLKARGNVEEWLGNLDISMQKSIKREMKNGYIKFATKARKSWVLKHPAQIVSTISMVMWSFSTEEAIANYEANNDAVYEWYDACVSNLNELTTVVRSKLTDIQRKSVIALVTQTVHNRDVIAALKQIEGISLSHFKWQQQLRYYWEAESEDVILRQMNGMFEYGNEFMGATTRLVITPLTDRCWLTITGALSMKLGAAPAGPAGTGKTESTKDLAKAMGRYCVVFNCSEQVTYQMMEKLFMGLCYTGAWTCLDEFNRIDIEVLSVIASQLRIIRKARLEERSEFIFEDKLIKLVHSMGVFITMNPGYAGRVELPDNLKVLFRPVSMMVPDYTLIAEIMLYAEGFSDAKELSVKMTKLYKLSSEQLSQQDHYDFGMRAVKSVLNMAGALKRKEPHLKEDVILIRAMKESNIPKFLHDDIILFDAIVQDLFPSVKIPLVDSGSLELSISSIISTRNLQPTEGFIEKTLQLCNLLSVRFGVMIVGPATAGKTTCYTTLAQSLTHLHDQYRSDVYSKVIYSVLNPKSITMGELYGEFNDITQEWKDGLASSIMRDFARSETKEQKWLVFDGPVDSLWIENMNTVLDDNMTLCLGNGERIKLKNNMRMVFEVLDLAAASPATVSRCGMVYMNIEAVGWKPIVKSWIERELEDWQQQAKDHLWLLFSSYIDKALTFIRRGLSEPIPTMNNSLVQSVCNIIRALTRPRVCPRLRDDFEYFKKYIEKVFLFAVTWGLGGALDISSAKRFDHRFCTDYSNDLPKGSLYDSFVDPAKKCGEYKPWETITPPYQYDPEVSFSDILVHTSDTTKFAYLIKLGVTELKPVFITGYTGVGKSVIVSNTLASLKDKESIYPVYMTFSARTSSSQTQNSILSKLDSKRKDLYGAPGANKAVLVIDDVNMPSVEQYGAQPPIELMRQLCDGGYFFEREKLFKIKVIDTTVICCAAPPEGGRHPLTSRFTRHFHILCIPPANEDTLSSIYRQILEGFLKPFKPEVQGLLNHIVSSTITLYNTLSKELLPIPAKTHYIFNTRDVSKVFQGILMSSAKNYSTPDSMIKLWIHENMRVFHDRLINKEDRTWFTKNIVRMLILYFRKTVTYEELFEEAPPVIFGDFVKGDLDVEDREYLEFPSIEYLAKKVSEFISDYNYSNSIHINLVLFQDALEHLARICRILRQPQGNCMLVGVGGCGKQTLTKLAAYITHCDLFCIQVTKDYKHSMFREELKNLYLKTGGLDGKRTVFLMNDSQILQESFLEDINNILNSGEVPNLFSKEELEVIENDLRPLADKKKVYDVYSFFLSRVKENLHLVLCMSPIGDTLRVRMRMFPSLVNCCTINWVDSWPQDALLSVSKKRFEELSIKDIEPVNHEKVKTVLTEIVVKIQSAVQTVAEEFDAELKRKVYVTPKSFLDMIKLYFRLLDEKKFTVTYFRDRYMKGVNKLVQTNLEVAKMQENLTSMAPVLEHKKIEAERLAVAVEADSIAANEVKELALADEREVNMRTKEIMRLQEDAEADLRLAMPALESAIKALDQINSKDIAEIRTFPNPPALVVYTLEAIAIALEQKTDWDSIKRILQNNFIDTLKFFPKDNIKPATLKKLRQKISTNPNFTPEKVGTVNTASKSLCQWVFAIENYAKIAKEVEPKKQHLERMNRVLCDAQDNLQRTQARLNAELEKVQALERSLNEVILDRDQLDEEIKRTHVRLERASVLTEGLRDEHKRWEETAQKLSTNIIYILGDVLLSAACINYGGPFTGVYRKKLVAAWSKLCADYGVAVSSKFDLCEVMADELSVRVI